MPTAMRLQQRSGDLPSTMEREQQRPGDIYFTNHSRQMILLDTPTIPKKKPVTVERSETGIYNIARERNVLINSSSMLVNSCRSHRTMALMLLAILLVLLFVGAAVAFGLRILKFDPEAFANLRGFVAKKN